MDLIRDIDKDTIKKYAVSATIKCRNPRGAEGAYIPRCRLRSGILFIKT